VVVVETVLLVRLVDIAHLLHPLLVHLRVFEVLEGGVLVEEERVVGGKLFKKNLDLFVIVFKMEKLAKKVQQVLGENLVAVYSYEQST